MTTSVDILFKELPAMSRADERISRPDASSIGSDDARDRSYVSKREKQKSFEKYIEDHDVTNERHDAVNQYGKDVPPATEGKDFKDQFRSVEDQRSPKENENVTIDKPIQHKAEESENLTDSIKGTDKNNEVTISRSDLKTEDKAPTFTTKDLMLTEATAEKSALQNNIYSAQNNIKPTATNISDHISINSASHKNNPDQSSGQHFDQGKSPNYGAQSSVTNIIDSAVKTAPLFTVVTDNKAVKNSNGVKETTSIINVGELTNEKTLVSNEPTNIIKPERVLQNELKPESKITNETNGQLSAGNIIPVKTDTDEINLKTSYNQNDQQSSRVSDTKGILPLNQDTIVDELAPILNAAVNTMDQAISNDELMQKPIPQPEIVAIETTKSLPFAVTQSPNSVSKSTNTSKKSGSSVASISGAANQSGLNKAQSVVQNTIAQAMLQNAQKSDIQIDLGLNGQKFDTPLGQTMSSSGQTSLPANSVLAAQDVSFQKTLSAVSPAKTDVPMNAKMINEQITVAINKNVVKGLNNFSIRLHPAELGQVDIKLEFAADGKMHAAMMVESEKTLTMLQRDQASLEKALQDAGINLSNKDMNFSLMKQNQENNANKFAGLNGSTKANNEIEDLTELGTMQEIRMSYSNQALDISV